MEYKKIQYRTFNKLFTITPNHFQSKEGYEPVEMFETYGEEVDYAWEMSKQNRCWTVFASNKMVIMLLKCVNIGHH